MNKEGPAHIHVLFLDAFNTGDIDSLIALYESNAVLIVNGQPVTGQQQIRTAYESFLARRPRMALTTRSVAVFDNSLAVLHGDWVLEPAPGDETGNTTQGLSTEVVRRQPDGSWRFVIDNPHTPQ
ncbi:MAG: SgcJ/EcaC family oxidoreductase [Acidobacteriia bacterium]|nr:SgcJ/EcaC family oxidoreductase [Terriglobia bacterium]